LLHRAECDWSARSEALLFAAARADHIEKRIRPALERGAWVLCDRFVDSTRAYQGLTGGIADAEIMRLHHIGCQGLMPDRTLVLRLPASQANARRQQRNGAVADRFEGRDASFHAAVVAAFERLAVEEPDRFRTVDASGDKEAVTARLLAALSDLAGNGMQAA
jgi:dTMP kinase